MATILASVNDRNSSAPIRNAYFSHSYWNRGDGNYEVYNVNVGTRIWCDADGWRVRYLTIEGPSIQVTLEAAPWPER
jgi:hypothetical protein